MRRVLHEFPDKLVVPMLKNTVSATGPDSRLVIGDMLLPDRVTVGGPWTAYWIDLALLTICGKLRSLREWNGIFEEVGLELVEIYKADDGQTVMLETRLRRSS
ncbi:a6501562-32d9-45ef-8918-99501dca2429 [Sclerotinia trifoliorum]|uniref:A6501562-32d9-45ef-8918-99501dca2429 n=1 Tax=Sclerotinia trifoliorum TaxID=28548 RepID=A0A8H2VN82_9HELO|nr:a6501562-32d9-45ef-8918-99501dca2429 [Sclerotinia trifoliorum]